MAHTVHPANPSTQETEDNANLPLLVSGNPNKMPSNENFSSIEHVFIPDDVDENAGFSFRKLWAFMGPGFLVSIAYIDPGNFAVDIQAGSQFKYMLAWVLFFATALGLLLQSLCAKLGIVTGRNLAQACREEYPKPVVYTLWIIAEVTVIASDIPEVIGTAIAFELLFGWPLYVGVLVTSVSVLIFLGLSYFGVRKIEFFIAMLMAIMWVCFFVEFALSHVNFGEMLEGLFVPRVNEKSLFSAVAITGAVVMPHNLFLHSALVQTRRVSRTRHALKGAVMYNIVESAIALFFSLTINVSILAVAAANFYPTDDDISLQQAPELLRQVLNARASKALFAVALLASGQSSTMTGTYAGQFVMEGFIQLHISPWLRALLTRSIAILPSLTVALIAGGESTNLIVLSQVVLSVVLPFALFPLLKFTSSKQAMGEFVLGYWLGRFTGLIGLILTVANVALVVTTLIPWFKVLSGVKLGFACIAAALFGFTYLSFLFYLLRKPVQLSGPPPMRELPGVTVNDIEEEQGTPTRYA